ncbi:uncharacterized protein LOC134232581 [Saccostrea cucullata]|uniref:uncharacterized protein LOC134232581 n=1 Tax=Saccostrea cuccullata TaxID=36930 RepID=UPI002ED5CF6D
MKAAFVGVLAWLAYITTCNSMLNSKEYLNHIRDCKTTCREMDWEPKCTKNLVNDQKQTIAFYAVLTSSINALANGAIVKYGIVELNVGKGYDRDTGVFTAKEAGIYSFSWCYLTKKGYTAYISGYVEAKEYSRATIDHQASTWMTTCGHMVVALKTGNKVSTKNVSGKNIYLHRANSYFMGYKL